MRQAIGDIKTVTPVVLDIEPSENGEVLYQRVVPPAQGDPAKAMVFFYLNAHNQTEGTVTARGMTVSFPGPHGSVTLLPSRDVAIGPGQTKSIWMKGGEEIMLGENVPGTIEVSIVFDGLAEPVMKSWPLVPHARKWAFFAKPEDNPDYGEYVVLPGDHLGGGGGQHFAYDAKVYGLSQSGEMGKYKTGTKTNEDHFSWGRPVYAMADGVVVRAVDDHPDNPSGGRAFGRTEGVYQGNADITAVATANLSPNATDLDDICRFFVAVVTNGVLHGHFLDQNNDGSVVNYLAGAGGPPASGGLSVAGITEKQAVTAHSIGGDVRLVLWELSNDASSVQVKDELHLIGTSEAKVVKLGSRRVAVLGRKNGNLSLTIQEWSQSGQFDALNNGSAGGGSIGDFDLVKLTSTRVAAALQTGGNGLKLIVWDIGTGGGGNPDGFSTGNLSVIRVGEAEGLGTISEVALAAKNEEQIVTAFRTPSGKVKLIAWGVAESGEIDRLADVTDEEGDKIDLSFFKTKAYALGYRTPEGKMRLVAWEVNTDADTGVVSFKELYERETFGTTNQFSLTRVPTKQPTIVSALRTQTGVLKVILWQFTDSNLIYILHGNELMQFAHLLQGSIPDGLLTPGTPVTEGQMVGRMGHSGKSAGPHMHFHSVRVRDDLLADVDQLIADLAVGKGGIGAFRPMHFKDVRAVRTAGLVSGWANNPTTLLDGEGTYFEAYAIWPAPGNVQQVMVTSKKSEQRVQRTRERAAPVA